ncbi:MAG: electron transfer flavoprotein subunit beta/FixA family protein [Anaerolineae bacterium]|nr:electron transfer flavoprotein subunit beta/FixA family protein [Anaerolineae bacterium]
MHIVTITKSTPDTAAPVEVDAAGNVTWGDAPVVVNPWDEYAIEEALRLREAHGGSVTVISVGPELDNDALKHGVAMGCDAPLRIWDDALDGADAFGLARAAAAAIAQMGDVALVITGKEAVDVNTDALHLGLARALGWPALTFVSRIVEIDPEARTITIERLIEEGRQVVASRLPAVLSVVKDINEPRYPSFKGVRIAARTEIPVRSLADLGLSGDEVGGAAARTRRTAIYNPPQEAAALELIAAGSAAEAASLLVDKLIAEGVV